MRCWQTTRGCRCAAALRAVLLPKTWLAAMPSKHRTPLTCSSHTHTRTHTCLLQPTFTRLGVKYDARTAQALLRREPGLAGQLLYSVRAALGGLDANVKVGALRVCWPPRIVSCMLQTVHAALGGLDANVKLSVRILKSLATVPGYVRAPHSSQSSAAAAANARPSSALVPATSAGA